MLTKPGIVKDFFGVLATVALVLVLLWVIPALCNILAGVLAWVLGV